MMNIKSKNEEFTLFNQLSDEWWNENGKFKILHQIKSHRMTYILDQINNRNIKNLKIISEQGTNIFDLFKYKNVIFTSSSIKKIENRILNEKN